MRFLIWFFSFSFFVAVVGAIAADGNFVMMGPETFPLVVASRRAAKPVTVQRLY